MTFQLLFFDAVVFPTFALGAGNPHITPEMERAAESAGGAPALQPELRLI